jgi:hypothetical protein
MKPISAELREANRAGYRTFLSYTVLRVALLLCLTALHARAELPNAPAPQHVFSKTDWALSAGVFATHSADFLSTEQCIHGTRCKEVVLPQFLVHRDGLFAAYEFATASLEVYGAYELAKRGHPRMARVVQAVNVSLTARTAADNYRLAWHTPRPRT